MTAAFTSRLAASLRCSSPGLEQSQRQHSGLKSCRGGAPRRPSACADGVGASAFADVRAAGPSRRGFNRPVLDFAQALGASPTVVDIQLPKAYNNLRSCELCCELCPVNHSPPQSKSTCPTSRWNGKRQDYGGQDKTRFRFAKPL